MLTHRQKEKINGPRIRSIVFFSTTKWAKQACCSRNNVLANRIANIFHSRKPTGIFVYRMKQITRVLIYAALPSLTNRLTISVATISFTSPFLSFSKNLSSENRVLQRLREWRFTFENSTKLRCLWHSLRKLPGSQNSVSKLLHCDNVTGDEDAFYLSIQRV